MQIQYPETPLALRPGKLSESDLQSIGRLVRAFVELEDIITLFLFEITRVGNGAGRALLGRQPVSKRVQIAQQFLDKNDPRQKVLKDTFKSQDYIDVAGCRNAVAHGLLLGIDANGWLAFQTESMGEVGEDTVGMLVLSYPPALIQSLALKAEAMVPEFEKALGLQALRETRRAPVLQPRASPRAQGKSSKAQTPPPQSSRG